MRITHSKARTFGAAVSGLFPFFACLPHCRAQAPVLSGPFEDTVSPQLVQPLNQTSMSSNGGKSGDAGYGRVMWSVPPAGATVDAVLPQSSLPPQPSLPVASKLPAFYSPAAGSLTSPASSWTAGGAAVTGATLGRAATLSRAAGYTPASSFGGAATPAMAVGPGADGNTLSSAYTSLALQAVNAQALQENRPSAALPAQNTSLGTGVQPLVSASSMLGVRGNPNAVAQFEGSGTPSSRAASTQAQSGSDAEEDDSASHPLTTASSSRMEAFAPHGFQVPLATSPTSDGMVIRLIATADGLQIVLQTKNAINGSILGDQSGTSRRGGITTDGWWAWSAGAGSWAPINTMTTSPLMNSKDPGEALIDSLTPKSKLQKNTESADER